MGALLFWRPPSLTTYHSSLLRLHSQCQPCRMDDKGNNPGHNALENDHLNGPAAAVFPFYRGNGGDAGRIEEAENKKGKYGKSCQRRFNAGRSAIQNREGSHYAFLGHKAADEGGCHFPVSKAQW